MGLHYPKFFWYPAVFKNGFAYAEIGVGCPQDVGQTYKITGKKIPAGININAETPLDKPVPGEVFFGPTRHVRV